MDNSVDYLFKLKADLITQFKGRPNTRVLIAAVARQLQELRQGQEQLNRLRHISKGKGVQLDGIGDIVALSRTEAARLEMNRPNASEIDDEVYRKYLYYKMFLNTSTGTRREIMQALRFLWDEAPLYYSEDPQFPATIFVDTPQLAPHVPIDGLQEAPIIKPAGVRLIVRIHTRTENEGHRLRFTGLSTVKITKTQIAQIQPDMASKQLRNIYAPQWVITHTKTPLGAYGGD